MRPLPLSAREPLALVEPVERLGWDSRLTGDGASEASRIDLTFTADGTIRGIVESGLTEQSAAGHEMGWAGVLERLEAFATA